MTQNQYSCDVAIAGAGLAGLITAYELLKRGKRVILIDKNTADRIGGLAREAAGGVHCIDTPEQRRMGIKDSPELAISDWHSTAKFGEDDRWPKAWVDFYCHNSREYIYDFLKEIGVRFLLRPLWTERGVYGPGNTYPRWHLVWGTGHGMIRRLVAAIDALAQRDQLSFLWEHGVDRIDAQQGEFHGTVQGSGASFCVKAEALVVASGGIGGGDLSTIRKYWSKHGPQLPEHLLNGAHIYGDGLLHERIEDIGGRLTHLDKNWLYPAGVRHPEQRKPHDGISVVPSPQSLIVNAHGKRIGPRPLVSLFDTRDFVYAVLKEPGQYSWSVLNYRIACHSLMVSLSRYFEAVRAEKPLLLLRNALRGDQRRIDMLIREAPDDVLLAANLDELMDKMQEKSLPGFTIDRQQLRQHIEDYDAQIARGSRFYTDDQLRRVASLRQDLVSRLMIGPIRPILEQKSLPLMAIRQFPITRKSLGGIQTDLHCRVLDSHGQPLARLYAVGEATGYGGGGINGLGSPEGTFLGGSILSAHLCGRRLES